MKKVLTCVAAMILGSGIAVADSWKGSGSLYDQDRNLVSTYGLNVEISTSGPDTTVAVTVTLADGSTKLINCTTRGSETSWSKSCDDGMSGGGYYFDSGLISEYVQNSDGRAYATTLIIDGPSSMRILRTELHGDDAKRFFVETLTKEKAKQ